MCVYIHHIHVYICVCVCMLWHTEQVSEQYTIAVVNSGGSRRFSIMYASTNHQLYHLILLVSNIKSSVLLTLPGGAVCNL